MNSSGDGRIDRVVPALVAIGLVAITAGAVLGTDRRLGRVGLGLGIGAVLVAIGLVLLARKSRLGAAALVVLLLVGALPAGAMLMTAPTEPASASAAAKPTTTTTRPRPTTTAKPRPTTTPTSAPTVNGPDAPYHGAASPVDELKPFGEKVPKLYGFGANQPEQMSRPLVGGVSDTPMTPERRALLSRQIAQVRAAALRIGTVQGAIDEGYVKIHGYVLGNGIHYLNFDQLDDKVDLDYPEILTFPSDRRDEKIAGVALYVEGSAKAGPPQTLPTEAIPWHFHYDQCYKDGQFIGGEDEDCAAKGGTVRPELNGWMVDLWVVPGWDNPWGLISSKHPDLLSAYYCKLNGLDVQGNPLP